MRHHIIVKLKDRTDAETVANGALGLFSHLTASPEDGGVAGVHGVEVLRSCVDRANRYDLMVVIDMDPQALEAYDACVWHRRWKTEFSQYIESKAIFDCR